MAIRTHRGEPPCGLLARALGLIDAERQRFEGQRVTPGLAKGPSRTSSNSSSGPGHVRNLKHQLPLQISDLIGRDREIVRPM